MANQVIHFQFVVPDPAKTREFYGKVLDWGFRDDVAHNYTIIHTGAEPNGGIVRTQPGGKPGCLVYVAVDDVAATLAKVESAGGQVLQPETAIGGVGAFAVIADPDGNAVGIFRPA